MQHKSSSSSSWFWIFQVFVGSICIVLSIVLLLYGTKTTISEYIWLFLAGIGLIILGIERILSGILAVGVKRLSRLINIGVGAGLIIYIGSGFFYPEFATKWLIIFLGFGLLANGIIRLVKGLKKKSEEPYDFSSLGTGILITSISILILSFPKFGLVLLLLMTIVALAVSGVQVIIAGLRTRRQTLYSRTASLQVPNDTEQLSSMQNGKGIWKSGTWFRDEHSRYLLFRGVNFASRSKLPPYLPLSPLEIKEISNLNLQNEIQAMRVELDLLKKLGFNVVRLLISWKALEPVPNPNLDQLLPQGKKYLTHIEEIIDELHRRDISVILDFHQDVANEVYGGDGFPDWTIAIDKDHERPKHSPPDKKWQAKYMISKSLKHTYKSFWDNNLTNMEEGLENFPVRTHLERTIEQTVKFFKSLNEGLGHPAILGVEPFNEPHPGVFSKEEFEVNYLMNFYRNINTAIQKVDRNIFIFVEPRVDWTYSSEDGSMPINYGVLPLAIKDSFKMDFIKKVMVDKKIVSQKLVTHIPINLNSNFSSNGVLSFHYYNPMAIASSLVNIPESLYSYKKIFPMIFSQLIQAATERRLIPFLTEFGAFQEAEQVREYLNLQFTQIEKFLLNATIWNYDLYNTVDGKDNWNFENYSILGPSKKPRNIDAIARPYPMKSSAEPSLIFFDLDSKYCSIILKGKVLSEEPTIVYIPFEIHYSPEFTVWSSSKELKWDKENQLLFWYPSKDQTSHQLIIGNGKGDKPDPNMLPVESRELISNTSFSSTFS